MEQIHYAFGHSSLGEILVAASAHGLVAFEFVDDRTARLDALHHRLADAALVEDADGLAGTVGQLADLVEHPERDAEVMLDPRGSDYERRVWDALRDIPVGQTASYGTVAARLGTPRAAREVAEACAANQIAILIPCHRVVKQDGGISGYRWGGRRKRALLAREQASSAFALA